MTTLATDITEVRQQVQACIERLHRSRLMSRREVFRRLGRLLGMNPNHIRVDALTLAQCRQFLDVWGDVRPEFARPRRAEVQTIRRHHNHRQWCRARNRMQEREAIEL